MNRGEMTYSGSRPPSAGGQTVTAAMAAVGSPETKQENRQKLLAPPSVRDFERAAVFLGDVGHDGSPRGGGAQGTVLRAPAVRPAAAGRDLLPAGIAAVVAGELRGEWKCGFRVCRDRKPGLVCDTYRR